MLWTMLTKVKLNIKLVAYFWHIKIIINMKEKITIKKEKQATSDKLKKGNKPLEVFLRNSYRTHTTLSSLADRKANILIKFNSILISILIVFFKNIVELNPAALISSIGFLITALGSLTFATLAARPSITQSNRGSFDIDKVKQNIFFFGTYSNLTLENYEKAFAAMAKDIPTIYGNMSRDLYHHGKVLDTKFKHLKWSYDCFLTGLCFTVLAFLFSFFFFNN